MPDFALRPLLPEDLPAVHAHQRSPAAVRMAAFTPEDPDDRAAFDARWARILADPAVVARAVVLDGEVVGSVSVYGGPGEREVTYWISPAHWGRGLATRALAAVLTEVAERPLHARAARDNHASLRVLAKCGFTVCGEASGYAHGRGEVTGEFLLRLSG
jgi:RimJ/RimL family protein N-acetyltransferase